MGGWRRGSPAHLRWGNLLGWWKKVTVSRPLPALEIVQHPHAPLFAGPDGLTVLGQLMGEVGSGNFPDTDAFRQALAQAGFVSLWFFLKFIVGHAAEFDLLTPHLHLDMCNFRQRLLYPGCRGAMFLPRGHAKSKVVTEGGTAWELLRNPELKVRISNQIADYAQGFMKTVKGVWDGNELAKWLYGQPTDPWGSYCPANPRTQERWNDTEIVMPNRRKRYREASVEAGGVGGASEGHHYGLHVADDIIGLGALNANRGSSAEMTRTRNWFWGSEKALLDSMKRGRVVVVGTRYAVDDVYDDIIKRARSVTGYPMRGWTPSPEGKWTVYYRKAIEDGEVIFPEDFTAEGLAELAQDDYWAYVTQYLNDPQEAGLAELSDYKVRGCGLEYSISHNDWILTYYSDAVGKEVEVSLHDCDVRMSVDPAATEKYISAKTSRSVVGVMVTTSEGTKHLVRLHADFVKPQGMFDWIFEEARRFAAYLRATNLESNAGFKVLGPILQDQSITNGVWLHLKPFAAAGDKDARIRSNLQPELEGKRLYVAEPYISTVMEELMSFPQSGKKDVLDMLAIGVANAQVPPGEDEKREAREAEEAWAHRTSNVTGY